MSLTQIKPPPKSTPVVRLAKDVANSNVRARAEHVPGAIEAALPLTPERLELILAFADSRAPLADGITASRIAKRFAPRPPSLPSEPAPQPAAVELPPPAPFFAISSGIRRLTWVLILAALLPNLTLAAVWLRALDGPRDQSVPPSTASLVAAPQLSPPVLSAPASLEMSAGEHVGFPIALDGTDGVPAESVIVIGGLPQGSRLSSGHRQGMTEWSLKPDEIGDLHLVLPPFAVGESRLSIKLLAPGTRLLADASTTVRLVADRDAAALAPRETVEAAPVDTEAEAPSVAEASLAAMDETTAAIDAAPSSPAAQDEVELVPLPDRRPRAPTVEAATAGWVKPTAYVNLRSAPSSAAGVVAVVAKGTKLRVMSRKRSWVQVDDPSSEKSGWIYSGHAAAAP
jgi:hypothetical protein